LTSSMKSSALRQSPSKAAGIPIVIAAEPLLAGAAVPEPDVSPVPDTRAIGGCWVRVEGCCTYVVDIPASDDDEIGDSFFGCLSREMVAHLGDDTGVNDSGIGTSLICLLSCLGSLVVSMTSSSLSSTVSWSESAYMSGDGLLSCGAKLNSLPGRS